MTGMFIVSSRSRRIYLYRYLRLISFEINFLTPTTPIRGWNCRFWSHRGCPGRKNNFFAPYVNHLELCVKWLRNRQFKFHYSVFFSLHDMRKQGKTRRRKANIERNSHISPSSARRKVVSFFSSFRRANSSAKRARTLPPSRLSALHAHFELC